MGARSRASKVISPAEALELAVDLFPQPSLVMDKSGVILVVNDLLAELLGRGTEELSGRRLEEHFAERSRTLLAERFQRYLEAPRTGSQGQGLDLWAVRRDGTELPVEVALRSFSWEASTAVAGTLRDLRLQREAEEGLRLGERRFRIAASHTADMIQEVDLSADRMTYYGDIDAVFAYEPQEFPRTLSGWIELIHPEDRARIESDVERTLSSRVRQWQWRYRLRAGDETYRHVVDHGTFIRFGEDGLPTHGTGAVQDITEQVLKEKELENLLAQLQAARDRLAEENVYLREELQEGVDFSSVVGDSEPWRHAMAQARVVAGTDSTVLITGETGTGKELLARAVHAESDRRDRPMITVNCAALPSTLIESELFGHERGAFSGAERQRKGRFELADRGTLFLDEVGELPLELQAKLLRVLQIGEFERLGASKVLRSDVRVIAATNRDLGAEVRAGRFRSDLYYRLMVFPIRVPPLRERPEDVRLLANYFLAQQKVRRTKSIEVIPESAMIAMEAYDWPGNVRELENLIERAAILSSGDELQIDTSTLRPGIASSTGDSGLRVPVSEPSPEAPPASLEDVERAHVLSVLESCDWKVRGRGNAAERLGLKESTLRSRMKRLGIARPRS